MPFDRVAIIGVGLIGGSLGKALRERGLADEVIGCGRSPDNLEAAMQVGAIDQYTQDPAAAVREADLVVLGTPVGQIEGILERIVAALPESTIVTDVGSTKSNVVAAAHNILDEQLANFVPGHPIAGTEQQGASASDSRLFDGRRVILTPLENTAGKALETVRQMWETVGAVVTEMPAEHHDEVLAATSHLPHVLAYALVDQLAGMQEQREIFEYAAGGFRDFTRIASSSPEMWRDIVHANRKALLPVLDAFAEQLEEISRAIAEDDEATLMACFTRAKTTRDRLIALADPALAESAGRADGEVS